MNAIVHQQQPHSTACASACMAMILGLPIEDVIAEFHADYHAHKITVRQYLQGKGLQLKRLQQEDGLNEDGVYIVTVPSLNKLGGNHCVLFDLRDHCHMCFDIFDPNMGREGMRYYVSPFVKPTDPLAVNLQDGFRAENLVIYCEALGIDMMAEETAV